MRVPPLLILQSILAVGSAFAGGLRDEVTGLAVEEVPTNYTIKRGAADSNSNQVFAAWFVVKKPTDPKDIGCKVGFSPWPDDARFSQDQIDAQSQDPDQIVKSFVDDLLEDRPFTGSRSLGRYLISAYGKVVVAESNFNEMVDSFPEAAIEPSPRAKKLHAIVLIVNTREGKTVMSCASKRRNFEARLPEFGALARAVRPPR